MGQATIPLQIARFEVAGAEKKGNQHLAAGLFFLWTAAEGEETTPLDPARIELAFCSVYGVAHHIRNVKNPWFLVAEKDPKKGMIAAAPPLHFGKQHYLFLLIAHPSKTVAEQFLDRARKNETLPWQRVEAKGENSLTFTLSNKAEAYVPGGDARYGGWLLYRGMPYAALPEVKEQVKKLAVDLGNVRYPTADAGSHRAYAETEADHDGVFDLPMQAAVHAFQAAAAAKKAVKRNAAFTSPEHPTWDFLHTEAASVPEAKIASEDAGVVEAKTAAALVEWAKAGLQNAGRVLVKSVSQAGGKSDRLWGLPELWYRHWALEALCRALGAAYPPAIGSTFRHLGAAGAGQAVQSKHKLGMAFDLQANIPEPSKHVPFAYEADWVQEDGGFRPRWLLFIHCTLDPKGAIPTQALQGVPAALRARMEEHLGPALPSEAEAVLSEVSTFTTHLLSRIAAPSSAGLGSAFADEFLRTTVRRFQWRTNEDDGGDVMPEVTAAEDAKANQLASKAPLLSWLNLTRLAFGVGLDSIGARKDFRRTEFKPEPKKAFIKVRPADFVFDTQKASALDRIADAIETDMKEPEIKMYYPGADDFLGKAKPSDFDLDVLRDWIRRPSDPGKALPGASKSIGLEYAPKAFEKKKEVGNGIDLLVTVLFNSAAAAEQKKFFDARAQLQARVVSVGEGIKINLAIGNVLSLSDVQVALEEAKPVLGAPENSNIVRLRPVVLKGALSTVDPGRVYYNVRALAEPLSLEWWHLELPYGQDNWVKHASSIGFSEDVLLAKEVPPPDSAGPVWRGGAGIATPQLYPRPTQPSNSPGTPVSPKSDGANDAPLDMDTTGPGTISR